MQINELKKDLQPQRQPPTPLFYQLPAHLLISVTRTLRTRGRIIGNISGGRGGPAVAAGRGCSYAAELTPPDPFLCHRLRSDLPNLQGSFEKQMTPKAGPGQLPLGLSTGALPASGGDSAPWWPLRGQRGTDDKFGLHFNLQNLFYSIYRSELVSYSWQCFLFKDFDLSVELKAVHDQPKMALTTDTCRYNLISGELGCKRQKKNKHINKKNSSREVWDIEVKHKRKREINS